MRREPQLNEEILWEGHPARVEIPRSLRAIRVAAFLIAGVCTCFAIVAGLGLHMSPGPLLACGAWLATIGVTIPQAVHWWLGPVSYTVTTHHVIWKRGKLTRAIRRDQISYARIFWNASDPNIGDIDLVRAVPAGVLKRRLLIRLSGLAAPDKVWSLIRGQSSRSDSNAGARPLSQRLEDGERVLWSAQPAANWRRFMPLGSRRWRSLALALTLFVCGARLIATLTSNLETLIRSGGLAEQPLVLTALVTGEGLMLALLLGAAALLLNASTLGPGRQLEATQYLITNQRVLIQRGHEELHLDRKMIIDVINSPTLEGLRDVFLVLDGPQARALEVGGAFGETDRDAQLKPVLQAVADADSISQILLADPEQDAAHLAA